MIINKMIMVLFSGLLFFSSAHAYTKEKVEKRGVLKCGVSTGSPGFSTVDAQGKWTGLDIDVCRAVAAATLGDAEKVEYLPLSENESFTALLSGEVDVLSRHSTWTFSSDSALAVNFTGVSYYDGQGLLVSSKLAAKQLSDLKKVRVCSPVGSVFEQNLIENFLRQEVEYKIVPFDNLHLAVKGFEKEACDVISMQQSQLYGIRLGLSNPESAVVFSDVISREPLAPVVRQGDDAWFNIVKWSLYAMINGEELGVYSSNIEEMRISNRLDIKRLFGQEGAAAKGIGLKNDWAVQIIKQVGNYGEVFERNFGSGSAVKIERGLNKLWKNGGLQYAPPIR